MTVHLLLNDNASGLKKEIPAYLCRQGFESEVFSPESTANTIDYGLST